MKVRIKSDSGILPFYETEGSAGMDLKAYIDEPVILKPGQRMLVPTGLYIELPAGYEAQIRARSGLAIKKGIGLVNGIGTIDSDYRGEIKVILINWGDEDFVIENTRAEMCATLKRMIFEKSGITPDGVDIQFSINSDDTKTIVDVATVTIYSQNLCGNSEISEYVYGLTGKKPLICDKKE